MVTQKKRPKIVAVLGYLNFFDCLASISIIIVLYLLTDKGASDTSVVGISFFVLFSIGSGLVGLGMLSGRKWSWYAQFVLIGLAFYQVIGGFITYFTDRTSILNEIGYFGPFESIFLSVLCFFIIVYLNTKPVKRYFSIIP